MKFRKGNKIKFGQDFTFKKGIPHNIDFTIERFNEAHFIKDRKYRLIADGYGRKGNYGNGAIYPYGLSEKQNKLFEAEIFWRR